MDNEENKHAKGLPDFSDSLNTAGSPARPFHITLKPDWSEETKRLEDLIRDSRAFEGKFQSYVNSYTLMIPEELHHLFTSGGVLTVSTEKHLLLFGSTHWNRMQRILSNHVGVNPTDNELARHIYSHMHRFGKLNEDGSINLPIELIEYAGLDRDVAIIGMVYYAEIHDKKAYLSSGAPDKRESMLDRFRKMRNN
jgi:DNA-binding transcriptional regulator/RsmH inhibitor MraZ